MLTLRACGKNLAQGTLAKFVLVEGGSELPGKLWFLLGKPVALGRGRVSWYNLHASSPTLKTLSGHPPRHSYCMLPFVLDYPCVIRPQSLRVLS